MNNIAVLGNSVGDEGKGRIVHYFSPRYDWVIRFGGGSNAGHTIYRDGVKYIHNLLPSFDWRFSQTKCYLASGMVIDLEQLLKEVQEAEAVAYKKGHFAGSIANRIYVDPDAFCVLPEHKIEDTKSNSHIGTTNRGIGPAYLDKVARRGKRIKHFLMNYDGEQSSLIGQLRGLGVQFKHVLELMPQFEKSKLLFEGAQGVMLDINHGCYPFVSCGDSTVAGIYSSGFSFVKLDAVYGVSKAYVTKVGEGPFPTEIFNEKAEELRKLGNEYGSTTGRPRRIGWLDLPAIDYACKKGGITNLIITKLDILSGMEEIPLCVAYKEPPVCSEDFFTAKPQYITVPGWKNAADKNQTRTYLKYIEAFTGKKINLISVGVADHDIIEL